MSEKKQCINCGRGIDTAAKSCLYCNWWQAEKPAARSAPAPAEAAAAPPAPEHHLNRKILGAIAFVALVIIAFVIGSLVHGFEPSEVKAAQKPKAPEPAQVATQAPTPSPTESIPLVPDTNTAPSPIEQQTPPAGVTNTMNGAMGTDGTAMTAEQYGAAVQRAPQPQQVPPTVDPRAVTGPVYGQEQPVPPARPRPRRTTTAPHIAETQPVPEYQPVPSLHGHGRARLTLTVGTDGRVHDIDVVEPLQGDMGRLIGAVQSWRFRPATDHGVPVTSRFTVDINVE